MSQPDPQSPPSPSHVHVRFDAHDGSEIVDLEIAVERAGQLMSAIATAVRRIHGVIQRLELRIPGPGRRGRHRDTLDARIVVASDGSGLPRPQGALATAVLEAIDAALLAPA